MCSQPPDSPEEFDSEGLVRRRRLPTQFVQFDAPADDGSGDGPYKWSEILVKYLRPLEWRAIAAVVEY
jgi:hypothetical protein